MTKITATATLTLTTLDMDSTSIRSPSARGTRMNGEVTVTLGYDGRKMTVKADSCAWLEPDGSVALAAYDGSSWTEAAEEALVYDVGTLLRAEPSSKELQEADRVIKNALADVRIKRAVYDFGDAMPGDEVGASGNDSLVYLGDSYAVDVMTGGVYDDCGENGDPYLDDNYCSAPANLLAARPTGKAGTIGWLDWVIKVRQVAGIDDAVMETQISDENLRRDASRAVLAANPDLRHLA